MAQDIVSDATPGTSDEVAAESAGREVWVDRLRVVLIAGVIVLHTATGYVVDFAGWYYDDELDASGTASAVATVPSLLGGLFWLGPLFLVAGVFSARSIARRGPASFVRARLIRLGLPLLVFVVAINPLTDYLGNRWDEGWGFTTYLPKTEVGAMWFVAALLAFSIGYAVVRWWRPPSRHARPAGARHVLLAMGAVAVGSWLVWLRWPLTEDAVLNLKFAEWPQGAVLFALGVHGEEAGWVRRGASAPRVAALGWTALAGAFGFVGLLAVGMSNGSEDDLGPATEWPTITAAVLNGVVAVAFTLWAAIWLRTRLRADGRGARAARGSYAAYVVHPLVITLIMLAFAPVALGAWPKFVIVASLSVPICFSVGTTLTRLPGMSRIL